MQTPPSPSCLTCPSQILDSPDALALLFDILRTANKLKIPEMSLQAQLKKSAMKYARRSLISTDNLDLVYGEHLMDFLGPSEHLRDAAAASVFECWWNKVLDEPQYNTYCSFLEQMRVKYPQLDEDLNKRFDDKKAYVEQKREEKLQARAAGGGGGGGRGGRSGGKTENFHPTSSAADYPEATGPDGGWGDAAAAVGDGGGSESAQPMDWAETQTPVW